MGVWTSATLCRRLRSGRLGLVKSADLNDDGYPDLIAGNDFDDAFEVWLNDAAGGFVPAGSYVLYLPLSDVAVTDIDNDGDSDLVTVKNYNPLGVHVDYVRVFFNDGTAGFSQGPFAPVTGTPLRIAAADFDADGDVDVAVTQPFNNDVVVGRNDGTGNFLPALTLPTGAGPRHIAAADVDLDGDVDLLVNDSEDVSLLRNLGDATFSPRESYAHYSYESAFAAGDLDGDGDVGVLQTDPETWSATVLRNLTPSPAVGDCNSNLVADVCELLQNDCNSNFIPDECDGADCNTNGIMDACDIAEDTAQDADDDLVPDDCDTCVGMANPEQEAWLNRIVETGFTGKFGTLRFTPSGSLAVAYQDYLFSDLHLWIDLNNDLASSEDEILIIASEGSVGAKPSLAFDAEGRVRLACLSNEDIILKYWHDLNGDLDKTPDEVHTVSSSPQTVQHLSLAADGSDRATLAFDHPLNNGLAIWHDGNDNGAVETSELVTIGGSYTYAGQYASLSFDAAGLATVAHYKSSTGDLLLWHDLDGDFAGDAGETTVIDEGGNVGRYASLSFDWDGRATVAYHDVTKRDLKLWWDADADFAADSGEIRVIDSTGNVGQHASLTFDASARAVVAYFDGNARDLRLWRDADGDFAPDPEELEVVDSKGDVGGMRRWPCIPRWRLRALHTSARMRAH